MYLRTTYEQEFDDLFMYLKTKYPQKLFDLEGIGSQTDMGNFSKKFFGAITTTADGSVDANSNVDDLTVVAYENELPKPFTRLNSLYLLWKYSKKLFGLEFANKMVENELKGSYYINDLSNVQKPYSYNSETLIIVAEVNGSVPNIYTTTIKGLFKKFKDCVNVLKDREEIDLSNKNIFVLDGEEFVNLNYVLRHKTDKKILSIYTNNGNMICVTSDHPIILEDGFEVRAGNVKIGDKLKLSNIGLTFDIAGECQDIDYICRIIDDYGKFDESNKKILVEFPDYSMAQQFYNVCCVSDGVKANFNSYGYKCSIYLDFLYSNLKTFSEKSKIVNKNLHKLCLLESFNEDSSVSKIEDFTKFYKDDFVYDITTGTGTFYSNGLKCHNCFNFSTYDLMTKGLPFVKKIKSEPPKHLSSFCGQLVHFTSYASNQVMGAVGLADLLIVMSYYVKKEFEENPLIQEDYIWRNVKQELQAIIYSCNQPFRGGLQSGFYNVSVYDDYFLDSMIPDYLFPDGSNPDKNIVKKLQDMYINLMNETMEISPITFPVTTACFCVDSDRNILDEDFLDYISQKNKKWAFINIYAGESSTLSSCCFDGRQKTLTKVGNKVYNMSFSELYDSEIKNDENFLVFNDGKWSKAKVIRLKGSIINKIITENGKKMFVTGNHQFPTLNGLKFASNLTTEDYIKSTTFNYDTFVKDGTNVDYCLGRIAALAIKNGTEDSKNSYIIDVKNTDISKYESDIKQLRDYYLSDFIVTYKSYSDKIRIFIESFFFNSIVEKCKSDFGFNINVCSENYNFREGFLKSFLNDKYNDVYVENKHCVRNIEVLCTTLGISTDIKKRKDGYSVNILLTDSPVTSRYFKIKQIEKWEVLPEYVYCFQMDDEKDPFFTLPGGIISHNCRLRSKKNNEYLGYSNSFGSGGTQIGSFGVVTINLPQIALLSSKNEEDFFNRLGEMADFATKINHTKRYILQKRIDKGALPLYDFGFMSIQKQYATIGLTGINECVEIMGYNILKEDGQNFCHKMFEFLNNFNDKMDSKFKYAHNLEQTPSENSAIKLASKDKLLGLQENYELYSNQFIPLVVNADLLDRIRLQGMFDSEFSGGSILHANFDSPVENYEDIKEMIRVAVKCGVVYHAINYNLQKCEDGHMSVGKKTICPVCGKPITDNYIRVVGFIVNVKNFHQTRREHDYAKRQFYSSTK